MKRYVMLKTRTHNGSVYRQGLTFVLGEEALEALSAYCIAEGEPLPTREDPALAEKRLIRAHCDEVERARKADEIARTAKLVSQRRALQRMAQLEREVANAVDEFETKTQGAIDA